MTELLRVGDELTIKWAGTTATYLITRVTKTLAMSMRKDGKREDVFKRTLSSNMSHPYQSYPPFQYSVLRNYGKKG